MVKLHEHLPELKTERKIYEKRKTQFVDMGIVANKIGYSGQSPVFCTRPSH